MMTQTATSRFLEGLDHREPPPSVSKLDVLRAIPRAETLAEIVMLLWHWAPSLVSLHLKALEQDECIAVSEGRYVLTDVGTRMVALAELAGL